MLRLQTGGAPDASTGGVESSFSGPVRGCIILCPTGHHLMLDCGRTDTRVQTRRLRWVAAIRFQPAEICGSKRPSGARASASNRSRPMQATRNLKRKPLQAMRNTIKEYQVRQPPPAAAKTSKRTWANQMATSQPRSVRGRGQRRAHENPSSLHQDRSTGHLHHRPGRPATGGSQSPHGPHIKAERPLRPMRTVSARLEGGAVGPSGSAPPRGAGPGLQVFGNRVQSGPSHRRSTGWDVTTSTSAASRKVLSAVVPIVDHPPPASAACWTSSVAPPPPPPPGRLSVGLVVG